MKLITPQIYPPMASQVISSKIYQRLLQEQLLPVITEALGLLQLHKEKRRVTRNATRLGMNPQIDPSNSNNLTICVNASVAAAAALAFSRRLAEKYTASKIAVDKADSVREWHLFFDTLSEVLTNLDPEHKGVCPNCLWTTLETIVNSGRAPILEPYFSLSNQSYPGPHLPEEKYCKIFLLTAKVVTYKTVQYSSEEHLEDIFISTSIARRLLRAAMLSFVPLLVFTVVSHIPSTVSWTLTNIFKMNPTQVMSLEGEPSSNSPSDTPPFTVTSNSIPLPPPPESKSPKVVPPHKAFAPSQEVVQQKTNSSATIEVAPTTGNRLEQKTQSDPSRENRSPGGGALPLGGRLPMGTNDHGDGQALPGQGRSNRNGYRGDGGALQGKGQPRNTTTKPSDSAVNDAPPFSRSNGSNFTPKKKQSASEIQILPVVNPAECKSISIDLHKLGMRRVHGSQTQSCSWKLGQENIVIGIRGDHLYATPPQNCKHWSTILSNFEDWRCEIQ